MKEVLQKIIASSGYCSRRKAEDLIRAGRVTLNGYVAKLGERADAADEITVNKQAISQASEKLYLMLNKPMGYTCTNRRFEGEKNIFSLLKLKVRLFTVGRLDKNSRGLVLLTNDGDLAAKLTHPKYTSEKVYEVKVADDDRLLKKVTIDGIVRALKRGVDLGEGEGLGFAQAAEYDYGTFTLVLTTGRKRQVRRMFAGLGLKVTDLKRVMQSGLRLGNLAEGQYRELTEMEVKSLRK